MKIAVVECMKSLHMNVQIFLCMKMSVYKCLKISGYDTMKSSVFESMKIMFKFDDYSDANLYSCGGALQVNKRLL